MKSSSSGRGRITIVLGIMAAASLLCALSSSRATAAEPETPAAKDGRAAAIVVQPTAAQRDAWRASMAKVPVPKQGCFTAAYPKTEWQEIPCTKAPVRPYPPAAGVRPDTVGNGNDVVAQVTGHISKAVGSFDSVSGVTTEAGQVGGTGPQVANTFSLQLNSNFFSTTTANCNNIPNCFGWEQFIYTNSGSAFIQSWLGRFGTPCPSTGGPAATGWIYYPPLNSCYGNSVAVAVPVQTIGNLGNITLTGTAGYGGSVSDTVILSVGGNLYTATGLDSVVNLAQGWQDAEFNIFGDCCGTSANFATGSTPTLVVRTSVDYGSPIAPSCFATGYTGETNNLSFGTAPVNPVPGTAPAIVFTESSAGVAPSACASATSIGDTHLTTFDGLYYDFQATGDFVLAEVGSDFIVQTRQALAVNPQATGQGWAQNVTINKAVATQMGKTRVAIYVGPTRLVIDGKPNNLAAGKTLLLASGVQVSLKGNQYVITSPSGDSVRAVLNNNNINTWMDVAVGLGRPSQTTVRGLLGNPNGNANELATASGTVLKAPVSFTDLYTTYADSWRVQPNAALLAADPKIRPGIPNQAFYAVDVDPKQAAHVRAVCTAAGVKDAALLEACALDTAVLGDATATKAFTHALPPRAVLARPVMTRATP
jgi:hypothetical protein